MAVVVEGIGRDWVALRLPSGKVSLATFGSLVDLTRVLGGAVQEQVVPAPAARPKPLPKAVVQYDCKTCGACCAPVDQGRTSYVGLEPGDLAGLSSSIRSAFTRGSDMATKKSVKGRRVCIALEGEIGIDCSCSIYSDRPAVCELFEPGGGECLKARAAFGVRS